MRTNTIWKSLLMSAAMLVSGAMTSCEKEEVTDFDAQISSSLGSSPTVNVAVEADGDYDFTVTSNTQWTATVEDAKNILTLSKTSGNAGETEVTATISATAADGDKATVTLQAMGYAFGYEIPVTQKLVFTVGGEQGPGLGTLEEPFTAAGANAKAKELGSGETSSESYYIKGIITSITESYTTQYGNATFYIGESVTATEKFYVYRAYYFDNKKYTNDSDPNINVGDEVVVYGKIANYNGTLETAQNAAYLYSLNGNTGSGDNSGEEPGETPGSDDENIITKAADVKAGTYYLAGYSESYNSTTYAPYSWHLWTGGIAESSGNCDMMTVNYQYNKEEKSLALNPNLSEQDAAKGVGVKVEIESAGKDNTWYIKYNGQYLYSKETDVNRRMALGTSPEEWVFSDHAKGGLNITNNGVTLGTAGATYNLLRSYGGAASSLTYGVALFLDTVSLDGEPSGGEDPNDPEEPTEGATIADVYSKGAGAYSIENAWVVSSNTQGYVISDSSNEYILVYTGAVDGIPAIGDKGTVSGTVAARPESNGSYLQFGQGTTFEKTGTESVELGTPTEYDNTKLDEYANLTGTNLRPVYATFSGKLSISGNYYNVNINGSSHTGSISYPSMDLSAYNGKNIKVTGFLIGYSSNGTYINISANSVELGEESDDPEDPEQPAPEEGEYSLVTAAPETWAGEYVIGYANGTTLYTLKEKYSGNDKTRSTFTYATTSDYNGATIKGAYNTVNVVAVGNYYALKYDQMYIGWTSSTGNSCEFMAITPTASDTDYLWTLSIENGIVQITNVGTTARRLQFNANNSQERFAIYAGTQKDVLLFTSGSTTGGGTTTPDPVEPEPTPDGAKTVTFEGGSTMTATSGTIDDISFEVVANDGNAPAYNENSAELRVYRYNGINFKASNNKTITSIVFTFSSTSYTGYEFGLNDSTGTYSLDGTTGTWTGSTSEVKFLNNGDKDHNVQARMKKIVVTYTE